MGLSARLPVPSWEMSLDVRTKTWVTWFLEWRAPHEAGFTSPPALVGGRITGRCSAGSHSASSAAHNLTSTFINLQKKNKKIIMWSLYMQGDNFKLWKQRILIQLGCMDIDYAIRKDELPKITDTNTLDRILFLGEHPNYEVHILKLTDIKGVHEHIMEMRDIVAQSRSSSKEKMSCFNAKERKISSQSEREISNSSQSDIKKDEKCFFCKKKEHVKKKCLKFQIWLEKKDNPTSFVCYESNMVNVNTNTWWIDFGSTIPISNSLRLGHISIDRIKRLVNDDEVLSTLDFIDFETCVDCIKEKSDRDGEYYGRYMEIGQHGIVAQYTMSGSPYQNCVPERRNRTLLDMVRSMLSSSKLPRFLWTEALKTTVSKGYGFYYPTHNTRIVESRNAKFLEYDLSMGAINSKHSFDIDHLIQMGVEQTIAEVQPIIEDQPVIEVPQVFDNISRLS
ncbi:hypothetical protein AAG906_000912 [Vitis piasezkii]